MSLLTAPIVKNSHKFNNADNHADNADNHGHIILSILDALLNFSFTTIKTTYL